MKNDKSQRHDGSGDFVLERVLEAEKNAEKRIAEAKVEAEDIQQRAKADAREISSRTDKRIQSFHADSHKKTKQTKHRLIQEFEADRLKHEEQSRRSETGPAVSRLALRLSGGETG